MVSVNVGSVRVMCVCNVVESEPIGVGKSQNGGSLMKGCIK